MRLRKLILTLSVGVILLASCAAPSVAPAPTPMPTPEETPTPTPAPTPTAPSPPTLELSQVKVACHYENVPSGWVRQQARIINALKETKTDFLWRGFFKYFPCPVKCSQFQQPDMVQMCERQGNSYELLENAISKIKEELPSLIFCAGVSAPTIGKKPGRCEWNPKTGERIERPELWELATDPGKWGINMSKERWQYEYAKRWEWVPKDLDYNLFDWQTPDGYCPDITNPRYQELLLGWMQGLVDAGADAIWIDLLFDQATEFCRIIGLDANHPAVRESCEAACKIVDEIHKYGHLKGRHIYVGSWALPFDYPPPDFDFIVVAPEEREVKEMKLDEAKWDKELTTIKERHGNVPVFAFLDFLFTTDSQLGIFSQRLSREEQIEFLKIADDFFDRRGVIFAYPIRGGNMGSDATILSYGWLNLYDSQAPEFQTYDTIKELAQSKKRG